MKLDEISLLEFLSKCSFEFGILDGEGEKAVEVNILNTDNTITTTNMKVRDIMYFTEYGTITIPGKFILEKSFVQINELLDRELSILIDEIFEGGITKSHIRSRMEEIALKIKDIVRNYIVIFIQHNNRLGDIIHSDQDDNRYLYNLIELGKYIRCVAKFEN